MVILPTVLRAGARQVQKFVAKQGKKQVRKLAERRLRGRKRSDDRKKRPTWKYVVVILLLSNPLILMGSVLAIVLIVVGSGTAMETARVSNIAAAMGPVCAPVVPSASEGAGGQAPSGRVLSPTQIAQYAAAVGFAGHDLTIAVAVALAESGGDLDAHNRNTNGTTDHGLWQINTVHTEESGFDPALASDPAYNAGWARQIFMDAGGWTPWSAFNNGRYLQFLADAAEGVDGAADAGPLPAGSCGSLIVAGGWPAEIEPYERYVGQATCDPTEKPGVRAFADMLIASYPVTGFSGIVRECSADGTSEHKEGRAFDWTASVFSTHERGVVRDALDRILATDEHGNDHALFRRLGLMYIIWNRQIFKSYESQRGLRPLCDPDDPNYEDCADRGWQPYDCDPNHPDYDDCHVNHVHFSFGWDGAMARTSFWTVQPEGPSGDAPALP
jgi:hypothetical protein